MNTSRRNFITKSLLLGAGVSIGSGSGLQANNSLFTHTQPQTQNTGSFKFSIFSKTLQWLDYIEMAQVVAEMGFDGIDLTVRPKGHVLPENVETDLPKAVEATKKAGIGIDMIVTSINDADDPLTERILKTASSLGIGQYRMDWLYYDENLSIAENLKLIQSKMSKLEALNKKYKIKGQYQNHSGKYTPNAAYGSAIWDLYQVLKEINSPWLGSQYDVMHAHVEGAFAWETGFKLITPYIQTIALKDYVWQKKDNKWVRESVPIGEGMVNFDYYFELLKRYKISCPVTMHYEYPLGGIEKGDKTLTSLTKEEVLAMMKKDLLFVKNLLKKKGLMD